jgi:hypothetical protein
VLKRFSLTIFMTVLSFTSWAQTYQTYYSGSDGTRVYLPLGKISFADSVVSFRLGYPKPITLLRDSSQCLQKPNYKKYDSPDFVSLGCNGELVLKFTNNGFMNLKGDDLYIFEVGPSREGTAIELSEDGEHWINAGTAPGGTSRIELD